MPHFGAYGRGVYGRAAYEAAASSGGIRIVADTPFAAEIASVLAADALLRLESAGAPATVANRAAMGPFGAYGRAAYGRAAYEAEASIAGVSVVADFPIAGETLISLPLTGHVSRAPLEFLASQYVPPIQVEWLALLPGDGRAPAEIVSRLIADGADPLEWTAVSGSAVIGDYLAPVEFLGRTEFDAALWSEVLPRSEADALVALESPSLARTGAAAGAEWRTNQQRAGFLPIEWAGGLAVTAHAFMAVELLSRASLDVGLSAEFLARLQADPFLALESLSLRRADTPAAAEWLLAEQRGPAVAIEWIGSQSVTGDALIPSGAMAVARGDAMIQVEMLGGAAVATVTGDARPPIEIVAAPLLQIGAGRFLATRGRIRLLRRN